MNEYLIPFIGLKIGKHQFEYQISNEFFDNFDYHEFENCDIKVEIILNKKDTMLELDFRQKGTVNVPCDRTGELFDLSVESDLKLFVKFGDDFNNESEELLILPHGEHQVDVSQYIYEMIALSVPVRRLHPDVFEEDDFFDDEEDFIEELEEQVEEEIKEENIDPRWDELKKLLTDK